MPDTIFLDFKNNASYTLATHASLIIVYRTYTPLDLSLVLCATGHSLVD